MASTPTPVVAVPPSGAWTMIRAMVGVGLACGLLIVGAYTWTLPVIERNKAEALERAIFRVVPGAVSVKTFRLTTDERFEPATGDGRGERRVWAAYDADRKLLGLALPAEGMGYQDTIRLLYGYSFEQEAIVGMQVLDSKETPGLGDRIETDPAFTENFKRLDVALAEGAEELAHPIEAVKPGQKQHPWQVDGITGATISSVAVAGMLGRSAAFWVPRVRRRIDDFREAG